MISIGLTSFVKTVCAPLAIPANAQPLPVMWNSGIATRFTADESNFQASRPVLIVARKLEFVSSTPFGSPVVPEVYS